MYWIVCQKLQQTNKFKVEIHIIAAVFPKSVCFTICAVKQKNYELCMLVQVEHDFLLPKET